MNNLKHASVEKIIEEIGNILTSLGENDSRVYLLKQYNKNDSFKGLAENLRKWKIEFADPKPAVKKKLDYHLNSLEEYFEERKVLEVYQGVNNKKQGTFFSLDDLSEALNALGEI